MAEDTTQKIMELFSVAPEVIDSEELLRELISAFGGIKGLAAQMVADYHSAEPGSAARNRIMILITSLAQKQTELSSGRYGVVGEMTDEELEAYVRQMTSTLGEAQPRGKSKKR